MQQQQGKGFKTFGMDTNSVIETIAQDDVIEAYNLRSGAGTDNDEGCGVNIESTTIVPATLPAGITKGVAAFGFKSIGQAPVIKYNSNGFNQIGLYDDATSAYTLLYTDKTNSGGQQLLNLTPTKYPIIKLINDKYVLFTDGFSSVGLFDLDRLKLGGYGTLLAEDFSLIKPQNLLPISAVYASDPGKASNFFKGKLFQFISQYVTIDYSSSAWSTMSKRIIPSQESTPSLGTDVRVNNAIIIDVNIGSIRVLTINVGARYGASLFSTIKSVDRSYVTALANTAVDIPNQIYEAYNPATNTYSFVYYNDTVNIPIAPTETDLAYDHVPLTAEAMEVANGNIIALAGITEGFERPETSVSLSVAGYDPNIDVPITTEPDPIKVSATYNSGAGSGLGGHKRQLKVYYQGVPHTGDVLTIQLYYVNTGDTGHTYTYTVPSGQDGNLEAVVRSFGNLPQYPGVYTEDGGVTWIIDFVGDPYEEIQSATVSLNNAGAPISKSIHALLDNSSYQLALSYRDTYGRYFPLETNNNFIFKTASYAQLLGNTNRVSWLINNSAAPKGAVDFQWLITPNSTTNSLLDVIANSITYKGSWGADSNTPTLAINIGTVGDAYQITTPSRPDDHRNLGNGEVQFNTGDYVVYNGKTWDVVSKKFADLTSSSNVMVFKINPLLLFNDTYSNSGVDTVLSYDYSPGDRCTLHYYINGSANTYFNSPCIEVQVLGYDPTSALVKMEKSSALSLATIAGKDVFLRLSSPKQSNQDASAVQSETVWYEIGERFTITNGVHDVLSGNITEGDVYYKTRVYKGAVDPNVLRNVKATDFNFSDFYHSAFTSYGRPRSYDDELEYSQRKAIMRWSQNYVLGSKNNGLTRFFAENIYGNADGETSSSFGWIIQMIQRGQTFVMLQELNVGYVPVFQTIITDKAEQEQVGISQKLFNQITYANKGIGIGLAKESMAVFEDNIYFVDPNKSEPIRAGLDGVGPISAKMSQFFKEFLISNYKAGNKIIGFYNIYFNEYIVSVQGDGGKLTTIVFSDLSWKILDDYIIAPGAITPANGAHSTVAYNSTTGIATYTPGAGYVGNDTSIISFMADGVATTKNVCLNWTAGSEDVVPFTFNSVTGQPLSTLVASNVIRVIGINIPVPISITGGQYSVNGGAFTSTAGTVRVDDLVQVRVTTSGTTNTGVTATLTIGPMVGSFTATTQYVNSFSFTDVINQPASTLIASNVITLGGLSVAPVTISVTGGEYRINGGAYVSTPGTISIGDTFQVRGTSSATPSGTTNVVLTILNRNDTFTITTTATIYYSVVKSGTFQKDCSGSPGTAGTYVEYTVPAGAYTSTISQADADAQAQADVTANGQGYANSHGTCIVAGKKGTFLVDFYDDTDADLCLYCDTVGVAESNIPVTARANNGGTGVARYPNDGRDPATCYLLSSDRLLLSTNVKMRFGVNMAYFISQYPAIDHFTFVMRGRTVSASSCTGLYALRDVSQGYLAMQPATGEPTKFIPTVIGASPSSTGYTSNIVSGGNGTTGVAVGSPVLKLDYIVSTDSFTITTF